MLDSWYCLDQVLPEGMSQVLRRLEVGNHKRRTLNTRLSSGTSAGTFTCPAGPYRKENAAAQCCQDHVWITTEQSVRFHTDEFDEMLCKMSVVQPIPVGVTFSNVVSKLKTQSSNVSFATFQWKETFELWALSFEKAFENVAPSVIGCNSNVISTRQTCSQRSGMAAGGKRRALGSASILFSRTNLLYFLNIDLDESRI